MILFFSLKYWHWLNREKRSLVLTYSEIKKTVLDLKLGILPDSYGRYTL